MTDEDWEAVIDTHLKGTFFAVRAAQQHMVEQKSGKIVLISSTSALGNRGQTNYSAAKAGLTQQTAERIGVPFEQFMEHVAKEVPLRRVGQPEDVASTIAFLCSEDAGYVSGQVIYVAGGPRA